MKPETKSYDGACHCGAVQFQVETDISDPVRCNCSFCTRRGALLQRVPENKFKLSSGAEDVSQYGARSFSDHFFCKHCGVHTFTRSSRSGKKSVVVNLACLRDLDLEGIEPRTFDGANLL